ncbi:MAG: matrixin family metalloprotease [Sedimentisphaerales bacterium]|nr:matrixin family metalloprotease [Sedimentisphaerales bacterium]
MKAKTLGTLVACLFVMSVFILVMLFSSETQATDKITTQGNADKTPPGLKKIPPGLEKIVFIHYKKERAKPVKPDKPGKPSGEPECYDFMGKGVKWQDLGIVCLVDPTNSKLGEEEVLDAMYEGAAEWEEWTSATLFGFENWHTSDNLSWDGDPGDEPDGVNELVFADYPQDGVIAVTVVWGYFSGPPSLREIFEFDILFDTDWPWGVSEGGDGVMDVCNIATHEIGHGLGLGDVYEDACSEVTMYGYSDSGDIIKRDLEEPDKIAIQELYGAPEG